MQNEPSSKTGLEMFIKDGRRHPERTCRYLATNRYKSREIPFDELITLPLYTTLVDLQRLAPGEVKRLAEIASERHKGDFVTALAKYCKGLDTLRRAAALFEGAIHLVESTSITARTTAEEREHWVSVSHAQLRWLQHCSSRVRCSQKVHNKTCLVSRICQQAEPRGAGRPGPVME
ncbi:uncharacterized protein B0H64DRAFT_413807 [Chaetomium fimeti]|uniref:Uncharacterized protein n=2 Tax=Chaetomium fimeti TaxID=1854472 RepID=A0AAE0H558_9PEZI|nr:hypothetical protein B0H64DRAFT_413807 [Chaetomium fimeti]